MSKTPVIDLNKSALVVAEFLRAFAYGECYGGCVRWEDLEVVFDKANEAAPGLYKNLLKEAKKATGL